jgi:hypothetical protein
MILMTRIHKVIFGTRHMSSLGHPFDQLQTGPNAEPGACPHLWPIVVGAAPNDVTAELDFARESPGSTRSFRSKGAKAIFVKAAEELRYFRAEYSENAPVVRRALAFLAKVPSGSDPDLLAEECPPGVPVRPFRDSGEPSNAAREGGNL